jgi:hypothetical protein
MGTVTQYNLANVRDALGGGNPVYMSNFFRGGPYVPANRTVGYTAREPASGDNYIRSWFGGTSYFWYENSQGVKGIYWNNTYVHEGGVGASAVTIGGITYYRGAFKESATGSKSNVVTWFYGIYRTYPSSYQQAINTGVPSSGTISISQLYGAANP